MFIQELNDVQLTFIDNQGVELDMFGDMYNLSLESRSRVVWTQSRGKPTGKRYSGEKGEKGSFGFEVRQLSDAAPHIIVDWVQHVGPCASLESTAGAVWSWHLKVKAKDRTISLHNLHPTEFSYAGEPPCSFTLKFEAESVSDDQG